jgi:hypothetical protein
MAVYCNNHMDNINILFVQMHGLELLLGSDGTVKRHGRLIVLHLLR